MSDPRHPQDVNDDDLEPEIAADDAGASAAAERMQKAGHDNQSDLSADLPSALASQIPGQSDGSTGTAGQAADDEELLIDGQEEVFSRSEVEQGRIEHLAGTNKTP